MAAEEGEGSPSLRLGAWLFRNRGWLPVPLYGLALAVPPTRWEGLALVALGEGARLAAVGHIGGPSRTRGDDVGSLVRSGPYAWVRNPLYVGNILLWTGVGVIAWPTVMALLPAMLLHYGLIVRWEERTLSRALGDPYRAYLREVPRWLPRPPAAPTGGRWSPSRALRTERGTLLVLALVLAGLVARGRWT